MKHYMYLLFIILCAILTGCAKENKDNEQIEETLYYVKYVSEGLDGNGIYAYNVSYTDETGSSRSFSNMTSDTFERTIGPVKVGFKASLRISVSNTNDERARAARIEIKKGNEPFVVKAGNSSQRIGVSVTYTIE